MAWVQQTGAGTKNWFKVFSSADGSRLAAVLEYGAVQTSTDFGVSWTEQAASGYKAWSFVDGSRDGQTLLASPPNDYLHLSTDGGVTWDTGLYVNTNFWNSCAISNDGQVLYAAAGSKIHVSLDGGTVWNEYEPYVWASNFNSMDCSDDGGVVYVCAYFGNVYFSTNHGVSWTDTGLNGEWQSIACSSDGSKVAVAGENTTIRISTDGGANWTAQTSAGSRLWSGITISDDGMVVYATARTGSIWSTRDGGATWVEELAPTANWKTIAGTRDLSRVIALDKPNYGYTYQEQKIAADSGTYSISGASSSLVMSRRVAADSGSYTVQGADIALVYTPSEPVTPDVSGGGGSSGLAQKKRVRQRIKTLRQVVEAAKKAREEEKAAAVRAEAVEVAVSAGLPIEAIQAADTLADVLRGIGAISRQINDEIKVAQIEARKATKDKRRAELQALRQVREQAIFAERQRIEAERIAEEYRQAAIVAENDEIAVMLLLVA